jgi:ATP-dependent DNA helicase RecG
MQVLELENGDSLKPRLGRLPDLGLVQTTGRTLGTRYFVAPDLLRGAGLDQMTTLKRIEPYRLKALILEDLERYPDSSSADVNRRVGPEISTRTVKRALDDLIAEDKVSYQGDKRWRRYRLSKA